MHIAYSALRPHQNSVKTRASARYRGYLAACSKHEQTIAAIRQYMPEWKPAFK